MICIDKIYKVLKLCNVLLFNVFCNNDKIYVICNFLLFSLQMIFITNLLFSEFLHYFIWYKSWNFEFWMKFLTEFLKICPEFFSPRLFRRNFIFLIFEDLVYLKNFCRDSWDFIKLYLRCLGYVVDKKMLLFVKARRTKFYIVVLILRMFHNFENKILTI